MATPTKNEPPTCFTTFIETTLPPLLVVFVVVFEYTVFLLLNIVPQLQAVYFNNLPSPDDPNAYVPSSEEIIGITVGFHLLFIMVIWSFFRAALTPAGAIPAAETPVCENKLQLISDAMTFVGIDADWIEMTEDNFHKLSES